MKYRKKSPVNTRLLKSARRDSNPRPRPWQGRTPPTEPLAHEIFISQHWHYIIYRRNLQYICKFFYNRNNIKQMFNSEKQETLTNQSS